LVVEITIDIESIVDRETARLVTGGSEKILTVIQILAGYASRSRARIIFRIVPVVSIADSCTRKRLSDPTVSHFCYLVQSSCFEVEFEFIVEVKMTIN